MNNLLNQQLDELLTGSQLRGPKLQCESALRVGAATLCRAAPSEITATTVECNLEGANLDTFASLVQEIADEYGLEASVHQHNQQQAACSVRFTWPLPPADVQPEKSLLARLFGH